MRKIILFMHTSLDGFVAGPNGEMDLIHVDEEIFGYATERTNNADTALYGRKTYEMMDAYWPTAADQPNAGRHDIEHSRWYNHVDKVVLSKSMKGAVPEKTKIISNDIKNAIAELKRQQGKEIVMFGSPGAAKALMEHNLIDEYWLFVNPILLGEGISLFGNIRARTKLQRMQIANLNSGVVCMHYVLEPDN